MRSAVEPMARARMSKIEGERLHSTPGLGRHIFTGAARGSERKPSNVTPRAWPPALCARLRLNHVVELGVVSEVDGVDLREAAQGPLGRERHGELVVRDLDLVVNALFEAAEGGEHRGGLLLGGRLGVLALVECELSVVEEAQRVRLAQHAGVDDERAVEGELLGAVAELESRERHEPHEEEEPALVRPLGRRLVGRGVGGAVGSARSRRGRGGGRHVLAVRLVALGFVAVRSGPFGPVDGGSGLVNGNLSLIRRGRRSLLRLLAGVLGVLRGGFGSVHGGLGVAGGGVGLSRSL
mmetsp:Transcript_22305/g.68821  ORF Transcript_22305/g.68821 Transcript_22305/m.68821 type:complete len:295 (-) Transcript_22305:81-965(-)